MSTTAVIILKTSGVGMSFRSRGAEGAWVRGPAKCTEHYNVLLVLSEWIPFFWQKTVL
jgi:hypothetical protein